MCIWPYLRGLFNAMLGMTDDHRDVAGVSCRLVNFVQSNAHSIIYQLQQLQAKVRET